MGCYPELSYLNSRINLTTKVQQCNTTTSLLLSRIEPFIPRWIRNEWVPLFPLKILMGLPAQAQTNLRSSNKVSTLLFKLCINHMGNIISNIILHLDICINVPRLISSTLHLHIILLCLHHSPHL